MNHAGDWEISNIDCESDWPQGQIIRLAQLKEQKKPTPHQIIHNNPETTHFTKIQKISSTHIHTFFQKKTKN